MENVQAIAAIIGLVGGVKLFFAEDKTGFYFFCVALVAGLVFGLLNWFGLSIQDGFLAALASSGLYVVGKKVGGQ